MLKLKSGDKKFVRPATLRVLHWLLAFSIFLSFFIFYDGDWPHRYLGYLALITFFLRVIYKLFISDQNILEISNCPKLAKLTHISIWFFTFLVGLTGFMLTLDKFWGEEWLENLHLQFSKGLIALVFFHLAGVFFDAHKKRRQTWMFIIK